MDGYGAPQAPRHDYGDMHQHRGGEYDDRMDAAKRMVCLAIVRFF